MIHIQIHKPILEIFRPGPVTHCRPEPPCVVTDIPKRESVKFLLALNIYKKQNLMSWSPAREILVLIHARAAA